MIYEMKGVTADAMREAMLTAREFTPEKIKNAREFEQEIVRGLRLENAPRAGSQFLSIVLPDAERRAVDLDWIRQAWKIEVAGSVHGRSDGRRRTGRDREPRGAGAIDAEGYNAAGVGRDDLGPAQKPNNPARTLEEEEREARANLRQVLNWLGDFLRCAVQQFVDFFFFVYVGHACLAQFVLLGEHWAVDPGTRAGSLSPSPCIGRSPTVGAPGCP